MLLLTTERAPISLLPPPFISVGTQETVGTVAADRLGVPGAGNAPRIPLLVSLIKLRTFPSISNFTNGFGVLTDP